MGSRAKRLMGWGVTVGAVALSGLYGAVVYSIADDSPTDLIACMNVETPWLSWTCKQVMYRASWTPENVAALNADAGVRYPLYLKDSAEAEKALSLFVSRGVDLNAISKPRGWTALHLAAAVAEVEQARLLLKHGARTDVRDTKNLTPLELALGVQQKQPLDPKAAEMVRLLESSSEPNGK